MIPHLVNEFGVGVDETDSNGRTPLHCAALHGNAANIQLLVNGGANKEARDNKGYTPLLTATQHDDSRKAKDCLRVLIKLPNVDVNAADNRGITTLHLIAATKNLADLMPDLINAGAKIEETNTNGETALHCAALIGHKKGIALLVDRGANVEAMDKSKRTPQMIAQSRGLSDWWEEDILPIIESRKKLDQGSGKSSV
ncbi:ankyrin, partial [Trichoderma velutinum]